MPITTADFRGRYIPKIIETVNRNDQTAVNNAEFMKSGIWKKVKSSTLYDDVREKESMAPLGRVEQGAELPENRLRDGFEKRISKVKYAAKAGYTMEMLEFDQFGVISDLTKGLMAGRAHTMEILTAAVLEYGHLATSSVPKANNVPIVDTEGADQNPLFYGSHPYKSDGSVTWKNRSTTLLDFSRSGIQAVDNDIDDWRLSNDALTNIQSDGVIIPRNMRWKAYELFKSEKQPETGNNAANSLHQRFGSGDYFVYRWLTSETDWYMKTTAPTEFKIRTAIESRIQKWYKEDNQTHWISNTTMFSLQVPKADKLYKVCAAA